ncbi:hypothetical protein FGIG_00898 [Fasciola gigantica]|uniref:Ubinuclein-2 n=1 Tax=Fasciola gigantica TaxID=46835 RepID=A0A504YX48_FASGI|nr:hypothetical protein FGIG_00898 [Fasciola gigantica]
MVTMQKSGSRKRVRIDDFLDPGDGYDSQDSFIDDSEAVDVYVAPNVSTKLGGFFVHEGVVEGLEDQNARIEAPVGSWQKPNPITRPVKKDKSKELLEKAVKRLSAPKVSPNVSRIKMQHLDSVFDAVLSSPTNAHALISPVGNSVKPENLVDTKSSLPALAVSSSTELSQTTNPPSLPSSLPTELVSRISELIKLASPSGSQQIRAVNKPFNRELLNLAAMLSSSKVNAAVRSAIFAYMESKLQWKRKSIARRLKKLSEANEDQKMHPLLDALSDAISRTMPALLEAYAKDKELHAERVKVWQQENRTTETDTGENQANGATTEGNAAKRNPKPGAPKKIFRWNNESRNLFQSIVTCRLESYQILNVKGPREEYLKALFPTLIHLWPEGWITNAALWRTALPVFQRFSAEHPVGNQTTSVSKTTTPSDNSPQATAGNSVQETNPKLFEYNAKSSSVSTNKVKSSTPNARQSITLNATLASKIAVTESTITSCSVTLQPITNMHHELINSSTTRSSPTTNTVQPVTPVSAASTSINLQQAIRSMLESKSNRPTGLSESSTHRSHTESPRTLHGGSPPCIQSLVHLRSTSPATVACVATISPSRSSCAKPSSVVQPIGTVAPRATLAQISNVLTHSGRSSLTITNAGHSSLIKSTDSAHAPPVISMANGSNSASLLSGITRDHSHSTSIGAPDNSVRVTAVRRQTAPVILNRAPKPIPSVPNNAATSVTQRTEPQRPLVLPSTVAGTYEKQSRQPVVYQSAPVALSVAQIDQLQQRAVSSSARPNPTATSCNSWLAATALLLQRPQPPPAHQQSNATSYNLPDASKSASTTHSGNQLTKSVPPSSSRAINPAFANPGSGTRP